MLTWQPQFDILSNMADKLAASYEMLLSVLPSLIACLQLHIALFNIESMLFRRRKDFLCSLNLTRSPRL